MSTVTIPQVRAWQPDRLGEAAGALGSAASAVEEQADSIGSALESALASAEGAWAQAAVARAAREAKTGVQLSDALDRARAALSTGSADVGGARTHLLDVIGSAQGAGFSVADDGSVTPPLLPFSPFDGLLERAKRDQAQGDLNGAAPGWADDITSALQSVGKADDAVAQALQGIEVPQDLESAVNAYLQRALANKDLLGSLGSTAAGGIALAAALKKAVGLFGRGKSFLSFLKASSAPITDYATFLKNLGAADDALLAFKNGAANGGLARFVLGSKAAKIAGKAFLPLTVATGAYDAITGGGYDGARGWVTRGAGLAGAAGGGALLASSAGLIALGPVGAGIAGAAVLGYGVWTLGNAVYDHWDDIKDFGSSAVSWTGDRLADAGEGIVKATDWAGDRLSDAGDTLADVGKGAVKTLSFGLL